MRTETKHSGCTEGRQAGAGMAETSRINRRGRRTRHRTMPVGGVLPCGCLDPSTPASSDHPPEYWVRSQRQLKSGHELPLGHR